MNNFWTAIIALTGLGTLIVAIIKLLSTKKNLSDITPLLDKLESKVKDNSERLLDSESATVSIIESHSEVLVDIVDLVGDFSNKQLDINSRIITFIEQMNKEIRTLLIFITIISRSMIMFMLVYVFNR